MKRDLISLESYSAAEIREILDITQKVKDNPENYSTVLKNQSVGLIFQKPSLRTRVSFDVGIGELGGHAIYLGPDEINLGVRESSADVSKTLSRYLNGIVARTFSNQDIEELAEHASVPVINGLSDAWHPCQALTDVFSILEKFKTLEGIKIAYIGDGNNVANSLIIACAKLGIHFSIATPVGYELDRKVTAQAIEYAQSSGAHLSFSHSPEEAVRDANAVYADVWVSMGQEEETQKRLNDFKGFQIDEKLMLLASSDHIFMHCLPAHRGQEVTAEVIDGKYSIIFDQAENRLHTQKAILIYLLNNSQ